jgi:hypothetical protein
VSDFYLTVPFPQAASRSAHLPDLAYSVPEELRALLEAASSARGHLDSCRDAVDTCGYPSPHPERAKLEAEVERAERDASRLYAEAQLWGAANADAWAGHLHRRYFQATQRIEAAAAEFAAAYAEAADCARLLPMVKSNPISLAVPHGGPPAAIASLLSPTVVMVREKLAGGLPGITA